MHKYELNSNKSISNRRKHIFYCIGCLNFTFFQFEFNYEWLDNILIDQIEYIMRRPDINLNEIELMTMEIDVRNMFLWYRLVKRSHIRATAATPSSPTSSTLVWANTIRNQIADADSSQSQYKLGELIIKLKMWL